MYDSKGKIAREKKPEKEQQSKSEGSYKGNSNRAAAKQKEQ